MSSADPYGYQQAIVSIISGMFKFRFFSLILILILAVTTVRGVNSVNGWEPVKTEIRNAKFVIKDAEVEILTAPGYIIVNTERQIDIKVFTILGRLVSAETLAPGASRLPLTTHGVYIVKVGELTCKIAL